MLTGHEAPGDRRLIGGLVAYATRLQKVARAAGVDLEAGPSSAEAAALAAAQEEAAERAAALVRPIRLSLHCEMPPPPPLNREGHFFS